MNEMPSDFLHQTTTFEYEDYRVIQYTADTIWKEHSYALVKDVSKEVVLIDPGHGILDFLTVISQEGWEVKFVIATHAHFDHIAGVADVEEQFGKICIIHPMEKKLFMHAPMYSLRFGNVPMKRPKGYILIDDKVQDELEKFGITVLWTPGHTQGGMTFFYRDIAFTGDTLLKEYVGRTDLPDSDEDEVIQSVTSIIREMKQRNIQRIYPGHGVPWDVTAACQWWNEHHNSAPHLDRFIG